VLILTLPVQVLVQIPTSTLTSYLRRGHESSPVAKEWESAGCDGISPELLTCAVGPISSFLHELFLRVWASGPEWREGIIVSLYKGKGPHNQCFSYCPISLLSVPGKVFANVLLVRLEPLLTSHWRPHQSEFSRGRSTMDAILAVCLSAEIHRAFVQPLNVAYITACTVVQAVV